jgi:AcrR family transcriptional regulator
MMHALGNEGKGCHAIVMTDGLPGRRSVRHGGQWAGILCVVTQAVTPPSTRGRRAEQKASTRAAITIAAQQLIATRGFDVVTVADIARAADVSHRTFYRYFPSKDDALLAAFRDFLDDFVALVSARPIEEHPIDALLHTLDTIANVVPVDADSFNWIYELIEREPGLGGAQHRLLIGAQDRLTALFASRLSVAPNTLEPRLYAAAATASYQTAVRTWVAIPRAERTMTVWSLGREALEAFARGLGTRPT